MKNLKSLLVCIFISITINSISEASNYDDFWDSIPKNNIEINPTSEGFYIGYERIIPFSNNAVLVFDIKNTSENNDDFGRTGFSFRYGISDKSLFSGRLETAWIEGQQNLGLKLAYDTNIIGCVLTGVKGISDSEILRSEETVQSSTNESSDSFLETSGDYDIYNRTTTTTKEMFIKETRFATPDGIMLDININLWKQFNFSFGGSHWEVDDWQENGYHANFSWQLTKTDMIGGHIANLNNETEGGISFKKRFSSFSDIFKIGDPIDNITDSTPLIQRMALISLATPPIRIITAAEYIQEKTETRIETTTEEIRVKKEQTPPAALPSVPSDTLPATNQAPTITTFQISPIAAGAPGFTIDSVSASDPDGSISTYTITSSIDGTLESGNWPLTPHAVGVKTSSQTHTITLRVTDNSGASTSASSNVNIP